MAIEGIISKAQEHIVCVDKLHPDLKLIVNQIPSGRVLKRPRGLQPGHFDDYMREIVRTIKLKPEVLPQGIGKEHTHVFFSHEISIGSPSKGGHPRRCLVFTIEPQGQAGKTISVPGKPTKFPLG